MMAIQYRVYGNDGAGGPVDYATPIASVEDTAFEVGPLSAPGDHTFAVRAFDPETGLAEANTEARTRIVLDAEGREVSSRPNPPHALTARPLAGGRCRVAWAYDPRGQAGTPFGFHVYRGLGPGHDRSSPAATLPFRAGTRAYFAVLDGLAAGVEHAIAVRAFNALGDEGDAATAAVVVDDDAPDEVDDLASTLAIDG